MANVGDENDPMRFQRNLESVERSGTRENFGQEDVRYTVLNQLTDVECQRTQELGVGRAKGEPRSTEWRCEVQGANGKDVIGVEEVEMEGGRSTVKETSDGGTLHTWEFGGGTDCAIKRAPYHHTEGQDRVLICPAPEESEGYDIVGNY